MKPRTLKIYVCSSMLFIWICLSTNLYPEKANTEIKNPPKKMTKAKKVEKTEEEWKSKLSEKQFYILRKAGTERPYGKEYEEFKKQGGGRYLCAGCDTELFTSETKFDSRCGWPSFYDPADAENVNTLDDFHLGYRRTEFDVRFGGHLGHVFKGRALTPLRTKDTASMEPFSNLFPLIRSPVRKKEEAK